MTIKTNVIALGTALVIGIGALAPITSAQAAPLASFSKVEIGTGAAGVEKVRRWRRHHHHGRHYRNGALIGLGAFALGAAVAAGASGAYARDCYYERARVWSPRIGAYVVKRVRVCN
ncbi:hypothetical protein [Acuticoccus mangrovi]|uniref:Uncharacterized protein n=1 Tax=Acuticoccus mangrovi TaxID=2796142 RepID=A0A934IJX0_9HYPH|nr:hypothetical protein [Acuticoccus mangrovi]MBJ3775127.1 hypothetical protein [Acuticoccus mangrovi]